MAESTKKKRSSSEDMMAMGSVVIIIVVIFLAVVLMFFSSSGSGSFDVDEQFDEFSTGWTIEAGDLSGTYNLPVMVNVGGGEEIVLSRKLPNDILDYSAIVTRNYHQVISVTVDGEEVYRHPEEYTWFNRAVISDDWNVAPIEEDMAGKTVEIRLQVHRIGFSGMIRPIYFGQRNAVLQYLRNEYLIMFLTGISVLVAGFILMAMGIMYRNYYKNQTRVLLGVMISISGVWLTNRSKMPILGMGREATFFFCFAALLVVPVVEFFYARERFEKHHKISEAGQWVMGFMVFVVLGVALVGGVPIDRLTLVAYLCMAAGMIYVWVLLIGCNFGKERKNRTKLEARMDMVELITTTLMLIGFIYETLAYTDELMTEVNMINRMAFNIFAIGHIINMLMSNFNDVKEREETISKLHDSQIELMMGQIQPHFVFNTLSSIRTLVKVDPDSAYNMLYDFSNYLRANVDNITNMDGVKFSAEVEHIKSYVNIEKVRFGERLNVEYDILEDDFIVPPLSIQPLVENAIKHGVCKRIEGGTVWLKSYSEGDNYVVEVTDDGVGFNPEKLDDDWNNQAYDSSTGEQMAMDLGQSEGFNLTGNGMEEHKSTGISHIKLRLKEISDAHMEIESTEGEGTTIKVYFPKQRIS